MPADVAELRRLQAAIPVGEWHVGWRKQDKPAIILDASPYTQHIAVAETDDLAAFIVKLRNALPGLLAEREALLVEIQALKDQLNAAEVNGACAADDAYSDGLDAGLNAAALTLPPKEETP